MPAYVIKVKDDRLSNHLRQALVITHDVVAALQVERARGVRQKLRVADDDGHTQAAHLHFRDGLEDDFRPDAGGVAHRDGYARQPRLLARRAHMG